MELSSLHSAGESDADRVTRLSRSEHHPNRQLDKGPQKQINMWGSNHNQPGDHWALGDEGRRAIGGRQLQALTDADTNTNISVKQVSMRQLEGKTLFIKDTDGIFRRVKLVNKKAHIEKNETVNENDDDDDDPNMNPILDGTKERMLCHRCESVHHFLAECPRKNTLRVWPKEDRPETAIAGGNIAKEDSKANHRPRATHTACHGATSAGSVPKDDRSQRGMVDLNEAELRNRRKSASRHTVGCPETQGATTALGHGQAGDRGAERNNETKTKMSNDCLRNIYNKAQPTCDYNYS
jgi:hypothetical protein